VLYWQFRVLVELHIKHQRAPKMKVVGIIFIFLTVLTSLNSDKCLEINHQISAAMSVFSDCTVPWWMHSSTSYCRWDPPFLERVQSPWSAQACSQGLLHLEVQQLQPYPIDRMVHEKRALLLDMVLVSVYWDDILIAVCCRNLYLLSWIKTSR
jgi:hypothetical protein